MQVFLNYILKGIDKDDVGKRRIDSIISKLKIDRIGYLEVGKFKLCLKAMAVLQQGMSLDDITILEQQQEVIQINQPIDGLVEKSIKLALKPSNSIKVSEIELDLLAEIYPAAKIFYQNQKDQENQKNLLVVLKVDVSGSAVSPDVLAHIQSLKNDLSSAYTYIETLQNQNKELLEKHNEFAKVTRKRLKELKKEMKTLTESTETDDTSKNLENMIVDLECLAGFA